MKRRNRLLSLRAVWAIPILAVLTLALGTTGWMDYSLSPLEALYRSVTLFDVGNGYYSEPPYRNDWRFFLGRWTGLGVVFSAALTALGAILQERLVTGAARNLRQQVVIIGGEGLATKAYDAAIAQGRSVVWLGADGLAADSVFALALPWPPQDRVRTVSEHTDGAEHILIAETDDAEALALIRAARKVAPSAFITCVMRDERLAEDAAATLNEARTRILSGAAVAARRLHRQHPAFLVARDKGHKRVHALIVGFGQTGQSIARDLIVNGRTTYLDKPAITVIDPRARALEGVLRARVPELDECADFTFIEGEIGTESVSPPPQDMLARITANGPVTASYLCLRSDAAGLGAAAMLQALLRGVEVRDATVYIRLRDSTTVGDGMGVGRGLDALIPFGDLDEVLIASEFMSPAPDAQARAFCEAYRASLDPAVRDDPANNSARPWDSLNETFRQANRDAVAHIAAKLASAGIPPALWRGLDGLPKLGPEHPLFRDETECEALARLEHERWNAQRRMDGWRWTAAPKKDEQTRRHPSLAAYDDLTEEVKEFDRIYVRETQAILKAAAKG